MDETSFKIAARKFFFVSAIFSFLRVSSPFDPWIGASYSDQGLCSRGKGLGYC